MILSLLFSFSSSLNTANLFDKSISLSSSIPVSSSFSLFNSVNNESIKLKYKSFTSAALTPKNNLFLFPIIFLNSFAS